MLRRSIAARIASIGLSSAMVVALSSCGIVGTSTEDSTAEPACIPGESVACACADGRSGAQVCLESGERFGAWECTGGGGGDETDGSTDDPGDAGASPGDASSTDPDDAGDSPDAAVPTETPLAAGVAITDVIAYQAVGIALVRDRVEVANRNAPIVIGKDMLLRVFVEPAAGFQARQLLAKLSLFDSNGQIATYEAKRNISAASTEGTLNSTFNFEIPGSQIKADTAFKVELRETTATPYSGDVSKAEWPTSGTTKFSAQSSNGNLKLTIVPYRYNGRVPDVSESHLKMFRDMFTSYPVPGVEITVHPVVDHSGTFSANGNGWSLLLNKTCNLRLNERAASNNYYFGIIVPTQTAYQFCGNGCVAGLAPLASANDNSGRCGIGLGFTTQGMAAETAIHEIGHAMGREHAPCGLGGQTSDRNYPYSNAGLGVWGWEPPMKRLRDPSSVKDMMSYCSPIWISDYTYKALFNRIAYVNALPLVKVPEGFPSKWRSIVIEADGSVVLGDTAELDSVPSGTPTVVELLDASGQKTGEVTGYLYETDHLPGGWVVVPESELAGAKAIRLEGKAPVAL